MMPDFELHPQLRKDCEEVLDWPLCKVLLMNNALVPWLILVPRVEGVEELHQLTSQQQYQLLQEVALLSSYLEYTYEPDKLNVAAIGNKVRQLWRGKNKIPVGLNLCGAIWPHHLMSKLNCRLC